MSLIIDYTDIIANGITNQLLYPPKQLLNKNIIIYIYQSKPFKN
jgi:hypothetical protein